MQQQFRVILITLIITSFIGIPSVLKAQSNIDSLLEQGQYLTAFEQLNECSQLSSVDCILKKVDLALNYYLNSYYHRAFSFIDLRPGEDLEQLRNEKAFGATPIAFQIDSTLLELQEKFPEDSRITKALGDFYNRIYQDFGERWGLSAEQLLEKSNNYYQEAYSNGVYDYYSLYVLGYYQSLFQNYFEAQNWFLRSLKLRPNEPLTNYSLAVTYLFDGLPQKGVEHATRAFHSYNDSLNKSDAARISGILLLKTNRTQEALSFFQKADSLHAHYRPTLLYLVVASLQLGNDSLIIENGSKALNSDLYAPQVAEELNSLFTKEEKQALLHIIYKRALQDNVNDMEACGNIHFHYGKLLFTEGQKQKAKRMIKKSRENFHVIFDDSHQVFEAIEQTLRHMKEAR
ncbi:hypothetical protein KDU71_22210 [Carboxylicivirga sediminis]|uniref:Tetratricopeptide repeat protein n=1 Tax=Carboxylicivirga sediminis TaxID=2006564 RepID=A0A941F7E5_9BACT|nr:hypothetical protein [Carboxylicivirga sediminis]MBR8538301.1 hypothetical protein [Carboxylicivirga sediminis]